jgi:flagellar hook-length control protein FliK
VSKPGDREVPVIAQSGPTEAAPAEGSSTGPLAIPVPQALTAPSPSQPRTGGVSTIIEPTENSRNLSGQAGTASAETTQSNATPTAVVAPTPPRTEQLAAAPATTPATNRIEPNPLERAVAHQVSRAVLQHLPDGGTRLVMRLTPPELGTVRVEFISRDGLMTARLMAEDEGVRQALDRALPHIRAEVRSDHPSISITVDRSDQRQGWGEGQARQERRSEQGHAQGRRRREDDEPAFSIDGVEAAPAALPARAAPILGSRVTRATVDALA